MSIQFESLCPGCFEEKGQVSLCPHCGYDESLDRGPLVLPHRTLLQGQYLVGRVLGKPGGFGITYLAFDTGLETRVAIKEYLPRDLAGRDGTQPTVKAHSREDGELFRYGLEQFLHEARTLAKFDHLHLVRIRHVFEANGTAYLVMDYYEGLTLAEYLHQKGRLPERTALDILMPILDGLREVHEKGFIHRDIKPQNIYLTHQGRPILLDFGAARLAMAERSRSLSVVLTPGYAPFEQYHRKGEQGPWTDVYACAAVLYQMVTGEAPPEATERVDEDGLKPPRQLARDLSPGLPEVLVKGLELSVKRRFQSIQEFQAALNKPTSAKSASIDQVSAALDKRAAEKASSRTPTNSAYPHGSASQNSGKAKFQKPAISYLALAGVAAIAIWTYLYNSGGSLSKPSEKPAVAQSSPLFPKKPITPFEQLKERANNNDTEAQFNLAMSYLNGDGTPQNAAEAVRWFRSAANGGKAKAQFMLGDIYESGRGGISKNLDEAQSWYKKAFNQEFKCAEVALDKLNFAADFNNYSKDNPPALGITLANISPYTARSLNLDRTEGVVILTVLPESPAEQGGLKKGDIILSVNGVAVVALDETIAEIRRNPTDEVNLVIYRDGKNIPFNTLTKRPYFQLQANAVNRYCLAAQAGDSEAQHQLGLSYEAGVILAKDGAKAIFWHNKAAKNGNIEAQVNLGQRYMIGQGVTKNTTLAKDWLHQAAEQGNPTAQFSLGLFYSTTDKHDKDYKESLKWYRLAAEQGIYVAENNIGIMYLNGYGVTANATEAVRWFKRAAEHGEGNAQGNLGIMYESGRGGLKTDPQQAVKWYQKCAEAGNQNCQYFLGNMYLWGKGIEKNSKQAEKWFREAAGQGHKDAKKALKNLR